MPKNKKLVAFLLLAAQCLAFSACGNAASETESVQTEVVETAAAVETEPELSDDLPARDYAGAEFRMLSYETVNCNGVHVVAEITGEGVNDATYKINRDLEERFGIIMKETLDSGMTNSGVQNTILAGDDAFELIFPYTNGSFAFLQKNCVLEYSMLPYVNLEKPYWVASLNESASIGGKYYYAMGGLDLSHMDYTHMLTFSKDMVVDYGLEDFYTLVDEGKWTLDAMEAAMALVTYDPDVKVHAPTDVYGFAATPKQILPNFWEAAGMQSIDKDENDVLYYAIPGNENFATLIDSIFSLLWDTGYWKQNNSTDGVDPDATTLMEEGRVLFTDTTFHYVKNLRILDADFGLLPYPKWDETQQEYHSRAEGGIRCPMVPMTVADPEYVSIIMEAMSLAGYKELLPATFEEGLKGKVSRDEESSKILDLIYETRILDLGDAVWISDIRDGFIREMFTNNNRNLTSNVERNRTKIENSLAEAMEIAAAQ